MKKRQRNPELAEVEREMAETAVLLRQARDAFNWVSDPDLIDAWVYQEQAMQAKYSYLIKRRRALEAAEEVAP